MSILAIAGAVVAIWVVASILATVAWSVIAHSLKPSDWEEKS